MKGIFFGRARGKSLFDREAFVSCYSNLL